MRPNEQAKKSNRSGATANPQFLLLDSCVIAAYYIPESASRTAMKKLPQRAKELVQFAKTDGAKRRRLLVPNFCIGEVYSTFAKYHYGKWNRQVKKPVDYVAYWGARIRFKNDLHNGILFQQYELSRYHILACDLISPVDHKYEFYRGKRKQKKPMGAFDHLFIAMGIELAKTRGRENVLLVTADRRLGDILDRAKQIKRRSAAKLGLVRIALDLGMEYGPSIYPQVVNLATATNKELKDAFGTWPLTIPAQPNAKKRPRLSEKQKDELIRLYRRLATESADSLSYSNEFEIVYDAFIASTGLSLSRHAVWKALVNLRKAKKLPTMRELRARRTRR